MNWKFWQRKKELEPQPESVIDKLYQAREDAIQAANAQVATSSAGFSNQTTYLPIAPPPGSLFIDPTSGQMMVHTSSGVIPASNMSGMSSFPITHINGHGAAYVYTPIQAESTESFSDFKKNLGEHLQSLKHELPSP